MYELLFCNISTATVLHWQWRHHTTTLSLKDWQARYSIEWPPQDRSKTIPDFVLNQICICIYIMVLLLSIGGPLKDLTFFKLLNLHSYQRYQRMTSWYLTTTKKSVHIKWRRYTDLVFPLQNLQALMNECIGHVIGKPHSPVTGLYIGEIIK